MKMITKSLLGLSCLCLIGCETTQDPFRFDGVTHGNGDAIAANTAMQMVDPWPRSAAETRFLVPAERVRPEQRASAPSTTSD